MSGRRFFDGAGDLLTESAVLANADAPGPKGIDPAGPEATDHHQKGANGPNTENHCQVWTDSDTDQGVHPNQCEQHKKWTEGYRVFLDDPHRDDLNRTLPVRRLSPLLLGLLTPPRHSEGDDRAGGALITKFTEFRAVFRQ